MSFTMLFAIFAVLALIVIFVIAYKVKGLRTALISTGVAFAVLAVTLVAAIALIVNSMPN